MCSMEVTKYAHTAHSMAGTGLVIKCTHIHVTAPDEEHKHAEDVNVAGVLCASGLALTTTQSR